MRRTLAILAVVLFAFAAVAAVERTLTPEESTAITAYITQRRAAFDAKAVEGHYPESAHATRRRPHDLCREYERYKYDVDKRRWTERPKFPGWDEACYTWYPDATYYNRQLFCTKCKGKVSSPLSGAVCDGWVNPSGVLCGRLHPLPIMDQWRFTARLIAEDHKKPMEAKAHVWNAHEHGELADAQYDELMGVIDSIPPPP